MAGFSKLKDSASAAVFDNLTPKSLALAAGTALVIWRVRGFLNSGKKR